jgi:stage IV sporulation protein FB
MNFLGYGIPLGRYFGINVRVHFTFLIYAYYRVQEYHNVLLGLAFVLGLYFCILLHEFGHALAARWCDGDATDILLWPLGGLAFVRPAFNPTAHLITTVAGPFVTLVLWLLLAALAYVLGRLEVVPSMLQGFLWGLSAYNLWLLMFNLIPAFPMDGGRILRDTLWHWMSAEKATTIAVWVSRVIAGLGAVFAIVTGNFFLLLFPAFIFLQTMNEQQIVAMEASGTYSFSIRERLQRGRKQRVFRQAVAERRRADATDAFHQCATCGVTEVTDPAMDFRVCPDCSAGQEYCRVHIEAHRHA